MGEMATIRNCTGTDTVTRAIAPFILHKAGYFASIKIDPHINNNNNKNLNDMKKTFNHFVD